ncbi:MAG: hypothetical protein EOM20_10030 [Spartobacteria bacterium]|nr:hypothetical protein [Spartobacteria bacterium]
MRGIGEEGYLLCEEQLQTSRAAAAPIDAARTATRIVPQAADGFQWPFLLWYDSDVIQKSNAVLLVETINTRRTSNHYGFTEEQALFHWRMSLDRWGALADRLVFLMPVNSPIVMPRCTRNV